MFKSMKDLVKLLASGKAPVMTAKQLDNRLATASVPVIVDVRQRDDYDEGHIPGAVHVPLAEIPRRMANLSKEADTVVVCYSGNSSNRAALFLLEQGFTAVYNLEGGMDAWPGEVTS